MSEKVVMKYNFTQLSLCYSEEYNVKSVEYCSMEHIYAWHGSVFMEWTSISSEGIETLNLINICLSQLHLFNQSMT